MIYMGVESGDDEVLRDINKGVNSEEIIKAAKMVKESQILLSATIILGIGGKSNSKKHAINTGKIINKIQPDYLGTLTLMLEKETKLYKKVLNNEFIMLKDIEILDEIKLLLENINVNKQVIFRCNHASNYISLKGVLPKDKEKIIDVINLCKRSNSIKEEKYRLL